MDFERGSTFGGVLTAIVFVGFVYLIVYDLQYNINNKPYTFEVRDRFMSPEEQKATVINLGDNKKSLEFMFGILATFENGTYDTSFNPLDNDYIEIIPFTWDTEKNNKEGLGYTYLGKGPDMELCGREREVELMGNFASLRYNSVCIRDESEVSIYGDAGETTGHREIGWEIVTCDSTKRATCKSREEIAMFLSRSNYFFDGLRSLVVEDQFSSDESTSSNYKGD